MTSRDPFPIPIASSRAVLYGTSMEALKIAVFEVANGITQTAVYLPHAPTANGGKSSSDRQLAHFPMA